MNKSELEKELEQFIKDKSEYEYKEKQIKDLILDYIKNKFSDIFSDFNIEIRDTDNTTGIFGFEISRIEGYIYHSENFWINDKGERKENFINIEILDNLCHEISKDLNINLYLFRKQKQVTSLKDIDKVADYILKIFTQKCSENELAVALKFSPREVKEKFLNKMLNVLPERRKRLLKEEVAILPDKISKFKHNLCISRLIGLLNEIIIENNDKFTIDYKTKVSVLVKPFTFDDLFLIEDRDFQILLREQINDEEIASLIMFSSEDKREHIRNKILNNISSRRAENIKEDINRKIGYNESIYKSAKEKIVLYAKDLAEKSVISIGDQEYIKG